MESHKEQSGNQIAATTSSLTTSSYHSAVTGQQHDQIESQVIDVDVLVLLKDCPGTSELTKIKVSPQMTSREVKNLIRGKNMPGVRAAFRTLLPRRRTLGRQCNDGRAQCSCQY